MSAGRVAIVLALFAWALPARAQAPAQPDDVPHFEVSDPMLTSPSAPRRVIASWEDASDLLRARSTDLRIAYDDVRRAEGQSRSALAGALPNLSARGVTAHQILPAGNDTTVTGGGSGRNSLTGSVSFSQPLIDVRAWHAIGTASVAEEVARLSYADLKRTTAANLAAAIVSTVTAERVAELDRVGLRNALERLALTEAKERTGTGTGLDIVRARQDVASARGSIISGDESLRQARETLGLALGLTEPVGVSPLTDLGSIESGALKSCRSLDALGKRADIAAARKRVEVAHRNATEVDQGFLPTLSAQSSLSSSITDAGGGARTSWNIEAVLSVPIWDGGARYGERRSAAAAEDQSYQSLVALQRVSTVELTQTRRAVEVAEEGRKVAAEAEALATDVDRLTLAAYRTGKGTSLDLIVSAAALRQAQINLALQEFSLVRARIARLLELATCSVAP